MRLLGAAYRKQKVKREEEIKKMLARLKNI